MTDVRVPGKDAGRSTKVPCMIEQRQGDVPRAVDEGGEVDVLAAEWVRADIDMELAAATTGHTFNAESVRMPYTGEVLTAWTNGKDIPLAQRPVFCDCLIPRCEHTR